MHKATKAALISALVFPGCGHFYLKYNVKGAVFSFFSVGCLYVLTTYLFNIAHDISNRILSGDIPLNAGSLMAEISSQLNASTDNSSNIAIILLLSCWGLATIDAFIVGRKLADVINDGN